MAFVGAPTATRPTCAMDDALAEDVLKRRFGFSRFRGRQSDAARAVLAGRDVLYIAATGSGKSLTFQFPTQYLRHAGPRGPASRSTTLVISPLVSLMEDQAAAMRASGVPVAALHGDTPNAGAEWQRALGGEFDLVYITPESALGRLEALRAMAAAGLVDLLAIDEAHCVSEWGADFRPNYRRLAELRAVLPGVPVLALTATATPRVRADIEAQLRLANPLRVVASFNRPNLHYVVRMKTKSMADDLRGALLDPATGNTTARAGCTIVYCLTVKEVHAVTDMINALRLPVHPSRRALLAGGGGDGGGGAPAPAAASSSSAAASAPAPTRVLPFGPGAGGSFVSPIAASLSRPAGGGGDGPLVLRAAAYHAQMPMGERMEVQKAFANDTLQVVVATISFGMGVDRRDVRLVVNWGLAKTLEAYSQQVGRAGRDGDPAQAVTLWSHADFATISNLIAHGASSKDAAAAGGGAPSSSSAAAAPSAESGFDAMKRFVMDTGGCRRAALLAYFGEDTSGGRPEYLPDNGCCDNCDQKARGGSGGGADGDGAPATHDFTADCRLLLQALAMCGPAVGQGKAISIVRGAREKALLEKFGGLARLQASGVYGKGADRPDRYWQGVLRLLLSRGLVEMRTNTASGGFSYSSYPLTPAGRAFSAPGCAATLPPLPVPEDMREYLAPARRGGGSGSGGGGLGLHAVGPSSSSAASSSSVAGLFPGHAVSPAEERLYAELDRLRWAIAQGEAGGVTPFAVVPNSVLRQLARLRPADAAGLRSIEGLDEYRTGKYGGRFLAVIRAACDKLGLPLGGGASLSSASAAAAPAAAAPAARAAPSPGGAGAASTASSLLSSPASQSAAAATAAAAVAVGPPQPPVDLTAFCVAGGINDSKREAWTRVVLQGQTPEAAGGAMVAHKKEGIRPETVTNYIAEGIDKGLLSTLTRGAVVTLPPPGSGGSPQQKARLSFGATAATATLTPGGGGTPSGGYTATGSGSAFLSAAAPLTAAAVGAAGGFPPLPRFADYDALARHVLVARCGAAPATVSALCTALREYVADALGGRVHWTPDAPPGSSGGSASVPLERLLRQAEDDAEVLAFTAAATGGGGGGEAGAGGSGGFKSSELMTRVPAPAHQCYRTLRLVLALIRARGRHLVEVAATAAAAGGRGGGSSSAGASAAGSPAEGGAARPAATAASAAAVDDDDDLGDGIDWAAVDSAGAAILAAAATGAAAPSPPAAAAVGAKRPLEPLPQQPAAPAAAPATKVARVGGGVGVASAAAAGSSGASGGGVTDAGIRAFIAQAVATPAAAAAGVPAVSLFSQLVLAHAPASSPSGRAQLFAAFEAALAALVAAGAVTDREGVVRRAAPAPPAATRGGDDNDFDDVGMPDGYDQDHVEDDDGLDF